jgi:hypothetical protein
MEDMVFGFQDDGNEMLGLGMMRTGNRLGR